MEEIKQNHTMQRMHLLEKIAALEKVSVLSRAHGVTVSANRSITPEGRDLTADGGSISDRNLFSTGDEGQHALVVQLWSQVLYLLLLP